MQTFNPTENVTQPDETCVAQPSTTSLPLRPGTPSRADLMMRLKERWSEHNRPFHFPHALVVLMGHVGLLQSHDAPLVHRATGFPLSFVSRVIFELLKSPVWQSDEGYIDLVRLGNEGDAMELDSQLGELLQRDLFYGDTFSELENEWYRLMGVHIEL